MDLGLKYDDSVMDYELSQRPKPQSSRVKEFYKEKSLPREEESNCSAEKHAFKLSIIRKQSAESKASYHHKFIPSKDSLYKQGFSFFGLAHLLIKARNKLLKMSPFRKLNNMNSQGQLQYLSDLACDKQVILKSIEKSNSKKKLTKKLTRTNTSRASRIFKAMKMLFNENPLVARGEEFLRVFRKRARKFSEQIPLISPNTYAKSLWDLLIFIMIIYNFFTIPIEISFQIEFYVDVDYLFKYLTMLANFSLILDIIIKFNTSVYKSGNLITSRIEIAKMYINSHELLLDLVSVVPKVVIDFIPGAYVWSLLFFIKYYQYKRFLTTLENLLDQNEKLQVLISIFDLLIKVIFFSHSVACSWHAIAFYNEADSITWLDYGRLRTAPWLEKYLNALYWIVACMVTCGFGEKVSPQNNNELISGVIFIMCGSGVLGYTISTIGGAKDLWQSKNKEMKKNLRIISRYMKSNNVDFDLQMKVRNYLEYILQGNNKEEIDNEEALISTLSFDLKEELLKSTNGKFLQKYAIFQKFSQGARDSILFKMRKECFKPEEKITLTTGPQNSGDFKLFMISSGEIELFVEKDGSKKKRFPLKLLKGGDMFGEIPFFSEQSGSVQAKSRGFSSAYTISLQALKEIAKENPNDYESFCHLRDSLVLYKDISSYQLQCFACNNIDHTFMTCPDVFFRPNKGRIIARYCYNPTNRLRRPKYKRKRTRKSENSLLNINKNKESAIVYRELNNEESSESDAEERRIDIEGQEASGSFEADYDDEKKLNKESSIDDHLKKLPEFTKTDKLVNLNSFIRIGEKELEEPRAFSKLLSFNRDPGSDFKALFTKQLTTSIEKEKTKLDGEKSLIIGSDDNKLKKPNMIALKFLNALKSQNNQAALLNSSIQEAKEPPLFAPEFDTMKISTFISLTITSIKS